MDPASRPVLVTVEMTVSSDRHAVPACPRPVRGRRVPVVSILPVPAPLRPIPPGRPGREGVTKSSLSRSPNQRQGNASPAAASNRHGEWIPAQVGVSRPQDEGRLRTPVSRDTWRDRLRREEPWSLGDRPSKTPTSPATSAPSVGTTSGRSSVWRSPTSACCAARSRPFVASNTRCASSPRRCIHLRRLDPQRRRSRQRSARQADLGCASSGPPCSTGGPSSLCTDRDARAGTVLAGCRRSPAVVRLSLSAPLRRGRRHTVSAEQAPAPPSSSSGSLDSRRLSVCSIGEVVSCIAPGSAALSRRWPVS